MPLCLSIPWLSQTLGFPQLTAVLYKMAMTSSNLRRVFQSWNMSLLVSLIIVYVLFRFFFSFTQPVC